MKRVTISCFWMAMGLSLTIVSVPLAATPASNALEDPAVSAQQIETDWLREDAVRGIVAPPSSRITPEQDAAGACDGAKDGLYGFHTAREAKPWWQIDLGRATPLDEMFVFNRCDGPGERARSLLVLLSLDGKAWEQVYQHDGSTFGGWTDNRPLVVPLAGRRAQFVRIQLPEENTCLHLDEVEIYPTTNHRNIALRMPATQSSASPWSAPSRQAVIKPEPYAVDHIVRRGRQLAESLHSMAVDVDAQVSQLDHVAHQVDQLDKDSPESTRQELYREARRAVRQMALSNPLLDFDDLLFVKRVPARFTVSPGSRTYTHMSDQYYGWFSRPGGGLYVLEDFKTDSPRLRCLTDSLPPGNIIRPDVSYDGTRVLFAYCRYYSETHALVNKLDKSKIPEDAFYHLFEMNLDGTGLRRLTHGKFDDFDGRYLPDGNIVFLSTRRGQYVQCNQASAKQSCAGSQPDSYVRCGGDEYRPVAVYTLHTIDGDGGNLRQISPFEMFEWTPSIDHEGRILYSRWDYIDRDAMPYMGLWSTMPDGTRTQAVFGNYTRSPHCMFEPRAIPGSQKIIFTASAHHSNTAGSLVLLDPSQGTDGSLPMKRLTPEVPFPEIEAWPETYFVNPYPLSEDHYLVAWSNRPLKNVGDDPGDASLGIYLFDAFGNLNLIYRDPKISCMYPLPVRARVRPQRQPAIAEANATEQGSLLLADVYRGLGDIERGSIRQLRLVGVPAKDHPVMNAPKMGLTRHDPGKFVLGTVPVQEDGSAHFRVPSGVSFFVQALDAQGMAVQTMRSAIYVQPGETITCIGCHEPRRTAPPNVPPLAASREPSRITAGPDGSWPLDFTTLVQPVLDKHCVECHKPDTDGSDFDLTPAKAFASLTNYGTPSLRTHVVTRHRQGRSTAGGCAAQRSPLLKTLRDGHYDVILAPNDMRRLVTWMDTYGQQQGSFSETQEQRLLRLRQTVSYLMTPP